jgi:predicted transcriptional regulator
MDQAREKEPEYFSQEDLADIEEGMEDIREGRCLTLEEYRSECRTGIARHHKS